MTSPLNRQLEALQEERAHQQDFINQLVEQAQTEDRDLVDAELANIKSAEERLGQIEQQASSLVGVLKRMESSAIVEARVAVKPRETAAVTVTAEHRDLGAVFAESDAVAQYRGHGQSEIVRIPEFRAVGPDPLLTTTDPGKKLLPAPQKFHGPEHFPTYPLLNLVGRLEVTTNSVGYWTTTEASGADVVTEGSAKPPVVWDAAEQTYTLQTVAGWFKFSRQAAQDIPMLRDLVNQKIRQAIDKKLADLALSALNTGKVAGNTTTGAAGVDLVVVVREAIAKMQAQNINPTAVLMNPADMAAYDAAMLGKPLGVATVNGGMWGLPLVPVPQLAAGTAVVGNLSQALVWFYRTGLDMYLTDSDVSGTGASMTSDFRSNILTALGEVRGVFGVVDPSAINFAVHTAKP